MYISDLNPVRRGVRERTVEGVGEAQWCRGVNYWDFKVSFGWWIISVYPVMKVGNHKDNK